MGGGSLISGMGPLVPFPVPSGPSRPQSFRLEVNLHVGSITEGLVFGAPAPAEMIGGNTWLANDLSIRIYDRQLTCNFVGTVLETGHFGLFHDRLLVKGCPNCWGTS